MTRCAPAVLAILAACGKGHEPTAPPAPGAPGASASAGSSGGPTGTSSGATGSGSASASASAAGDGFVCEPLPFVTTTPVPEASGAAWLTVDGKPVLLVVGDSGNNGAYGLVDPDTGATIETGALPLSDEASDDIEGVAARGERIFGITSSGWIREWRRTTAGATRFQLVDKPYPLGPIDLPDAKNNDRAPRGDGMVCNGRVVNCGRNYEGLCLAPSPPASPSPPSPPARPSGPCIGFAASKADGHLYCLTENAGKLVVHHDRSIAISRGGTVADCAFHDDGSLWVGNNMFDLGRVYRVTHWDDPAAAQVERVAALPLGFPETLAVRGDIVYRMSDMGGSPSMMARFRCRRPPARN